MSEIDRARKRIQERDELEERARGVRLAADSDRLPVDNNTTSSAEQTLKLKEQEFMQNPLVSRALGIFSDFASTVQRSERVTLQEETRVMSGAGYYHRGESNGLKLVQISSQGRDRVVTCLNREYEAISNDRLIKFGFSIFEYVYDPSLSISGVQIDFKKEGEKPILIDWSFAGSKHSGIAQLNGQSLDMVAELAAAVIDKGEYYYVPDPTPPHHRDDERGMAPLY